MQEPYTTIFYLAFRAGRNDTDKTTRDKCLLEMDELISLELGRESLLEAPAIVAEQVITAEQDKCDNCDSVLDGRDIESARCLSCGVMILPIYENCIPEQDLHDPFN